MATIVALKRIRLDENSKLVEDTKNILLNLTAGLAIKLKAHGIDVFASLDSEDTRNWITSLLRSQEPFIAIAHEICPDDPEIDDYLGSDSLDRLREAFLIELKNFSFQSSEKTLTTLVEESKTTLAIMDRELSDRLPGAMELLRKKAIEDIPNGEKLAEGLLKEYARYQRENAGEVYSGQ